jgi:hypothetical protein
MRSIYNRVAAFVEYARGSSLEEISQAMVIPLEELKRWCRNERWDVLAPKLSLATATNASPLVDDETARKRIAENRERNLETAQKLQRDLLEVVTKLRAGTLKSRRVFANGTEIEVEPTLRDRCDLALYARNVADISYRALGDAESTKNPSTDPAAPLAGQITIILPPLLAAPREKQAVEVESGMTVMVQAEAS